MTFLFTSESVTEGHPDKVCDRISDAILDACLEQDPHSRVACEVCCGGPSGSEVFVNIFGEITTSAKVDYESVARQVIRSIGYDDKEKKCFDYKTCDVRVLLGLQSLEISNAVSTTLDNLDMGAGDQGVVFGYASNESENRMPMTHSLASELAKQLEKQRKNGTIAWARPDAKTQVTIEYDGNLMHGSIRPKRVHTVVVSTQHDPDISNEQIREEIRRHVIDQVIPSELVDDQTIYYINPSGSFVIGGPVGDSGLTNRKIIVDTLGGWPSHGGGGLSGKDPSKVDRSGVYAARWVAVSLVSAGLAERVSVQLSYAIGIARPISINVTSYGTSTKTDEQLIEIVNRNFDLRPGAILRDLRLREPGYYPLSAYGHLGRTDVDRALWEIPKSLEL